MKKQRKEFYIKIKEVNAEEATLDAVFSTAKEDRHGDVVHQDWDLSNFKKNPVLLNSHQYSDATEVVGKVLNSKVSDKQLQGKVKFAVEENPKAKTIFDLYSGGYLNSFSVGFIPKEFNDKGEIEKSELLEISAVSVPSNAEANAKAKGIDVDKLYNGNNTQNQKSDRETPETDGDSSEEGGGEDKTDQTEKSKGNEKTKKTEEEINEIYDKYHDTVNMTASELDAWSQTKCSELASNSRNPIKRNLRLLKKNKSDWTSKDAKDANKTISFVNRMKANDRGEPASEDCPSKRDISLKNWAYDPNKKSIQTKSPACRQSDETQKECIRRKMPELIEEGYKQDQAVAMAYDMCSEKCEDKSVNEEKTEEKSEETKEKTEEKADIKKEIIKLANSEAKKRERGLNKVYEAIKTINSYTATADQAEAEQKKQIKKMVNKNIREMLKLK